MYKVKVEGYFSSAHNLREYKGKCEALHGHNWKVEIEVSSTTLDSCGMVIDFTVLKKNLDGLLAQLDHAYLNEIEFFKTVNPTSENLAKFVYDQLKNSCPGLSAVSVWESQRSCATFQP